MNNEQLMKNSLEMLDKVLPFIIVVFGISLMFFFIASALYSFVYFQKKANLKKSKELIEENRQIVEDAQFMYQNDKYKKVIEEQVNSIKESHTLLKKLRAEIEETELDKKRSKKSKDK